MNSSSEEITSGVECSVDEPTAFTINIPIKEPTANADAADINFSELSDSELLQYIEDNVYSSVVKQLDSDFYFVENVDAIYMSKEYWEEVAYNSQANIYFGYTLAELDECFEGSRYIFTVGEDGRTIVKEFEVFNNSYDEVVQVVKNVVTGTGVILLCVTVSAVTSHSAPAISLIFAISAKTGTTIALNNGLFSALAAGVVTASESGDFSQAFADAAIVGSEDFKWGAITGTFSGGVGSTIALKGATRNGLTMNQAATIQNKHPELSLDFIKNFHSMEEYNVYENASLKPVTVNNQKALVKAIDWDYVDSDGLTNVQRVQKGKAPIDSTGKSYQLHHVGQKSDSPLAILTQDEHQKNTKVLHYKNGNSNVEHGSVWEKQKKEFWRDFLQQTYTGF